ncbi:hypothetical protein C8Q78DRAFT_1077622 [Trametes maxima]|nr:hypothetical protein C8Q78DRAFT_1077622 [Trametes maxima]
MAGENRGPKKENAWDDDEKYYPETSRMQYWCYGIPFPTRLKVLCAEEILGEESRSLIPDNFLALVEAGKYIEGTIDILLRIDELVITTFAEYSGIRADRFQMRTTPKLPEDPSKGLDADIILAVAGKWARSPEELDVTKLAIPDEENLRHFAEELHYSLDDFCWYPDWDTHPEVLERGKRSSADH